MSDELRQIGLEICRDKLDISAVLGAKDALVVLAVIEDGVTYTAAYERAVQSVREISGYVNQLNNKVPGANGHQFADDPNFTLIGS